MKLKGRCSDWANLLVQPLVDVLRGAVDAMRTNGIPKAKNVEIIRAILWIFGEMGARISNYRSLTDYILFLMAWYEDDIQNLLNKLKRKPAKRFTKFWKPPLKKATSSSARTLSIFSG